MKPRLDLVLFSVQPSCYCPTQMINPTGIINQYNERLLVSGLFWFVPCYRAGVYFVTLSSPGKDLNLCIYFIHGGAKINRERDCWEDTNAAMAKVHKEIPLSWQRVWWVAIMDCSREELVNSVQNSIVHVLQQHSTHDGIFIQCV